ncbi:MAG: helix-turn-helix transcriptional regulator [Euryarchaeota archaeon]|nr:helix-turn-helix transcriptional regulator [Euryarchaeota archaeon]MDE1836039.1 helix-turn-helix transcriptional regulator [Euryarchaeota archaeon]MDE1881229.1 helix-turn-helix transcriptional regulator [Euryarchaeota archaeon]MDE2044017.1 helix-turn-helix transcriptional regulator [Thermoplasmata archaeon]
MRGDIESATTTVPRRAFAEPPSLSEFRQFARTSAEFSREAMQRLGLHPEAFMSRSVENNLAVSRALFGKWSAELVVVLYGQRELGFEDLRRHLTGVSPRILSKKLKDLERFGVVRRVTISTHPPRVRYSLTDHGIIVARIAEPLFLFLRFLSRYPPTDGHHRDGPSEAPRIEATIPPPVEVPRVL